MGGPYGFKIKELMMMIWEVKKYEKVKGDNDPSVDAADGELAHLGKHANTRHLQKKWCNCIYHL